jgi:hypothetical protein
MPKTTPLSGQVDRNVYVATCRFRVRTNLVCVVDQRFCRVGLDAWQSDVEPNAEKVAAIPEVQVDLGGGRPAPR